ncbi:MAG: diacylglycerol kinase family protein [Candidatus Omnitrophica bacterium]|nr:diacylglycerol kinase family protein [Candidatus Omnitrophota bacterium]
MRKPGCTEKYSNLLESTIGAACGLFYAIRTEKKIRQVFLCMVGFTIICMIADVGYFQILMIIFSWVLALICEIFNTALEAALDYACNKEFHPLIRQGKDYAAACTFVALVFAIFLTLFVLWERHFGEGYPRTKTFEVTASLENQK